MGAGAAAADCVTDVRLISSRSSVPNLVAGPAAWSGNVLAVAKTEEVNPKAIWVGVYDEALNPLLPDRAITTEASSNDGIIALLWNGSELGLFYRTTEVIRLQRLTSLGEPVGAPIPVNPGRPPRIGDDIEVVWSAALDAWVVARHIGTGPDRGIWATVVDMDGTHTLDELIPTSPPGNPQLALAVNETGIIGLFHLTTDDNVLLFTTVNTGRFPSTRTISSSGTDVQATTVDDLFVVARRVGVAPDAEIRWFVADSNRQLVRPDEVLVDGNGGLPEPIGLVATDSDLALTYSLPLPAQPAAPPELRLHRFTIDGTTISDTQFAGADPTATRAIPSDPLLWTGTSYITTAVRETSSRLDSYLERYCPLRVEIVAPRVQLVGQPVDFSASVDGGVPGYGYAWTVARDPGGSKSGATITRTFNVTGSRLVTLVVTDDDGASVTTTFTIDIVDEIVVPPIPKTKRRSARK
jgi:hypothetical protein